VPGTGNAPGIEPANGQWRTHVGAKIGDTAELFLVFYKEQFFPIDEMDLPVLLRTEFFLSSDHVPVTRRLLQNFLEAIAYFLGIRGNPIRSLVSFRLEGFKGRERFSHDNQII